MGSGIRTNKAAVKRPTRLLCWDFTHILLIAAEPLIKRPIRWPYRKRLNVSGYPAAANLAHWCAVPSAELRNHPWLFPVCRA